MRCEKISGSRPEGDCRHPDRIPHTCRPGQFRTIRRVAFPVVKSSRESAFASHSRQFGIARRKTILPCCPGPFQVPCQDEMLERFLPELFPVACRSIFPMLLSGLFLPCTSCRPCPSAFQLGQLSQLNSPDDSVRQSCRSISIPLPAYDWTNPSIAPCWR